ncbi:MAG: hypothetical protein KKG68_07010, partial [Verrucomicrobia bacterium]|nr:hypothetical protein [Verrucomicrobiota bacterium]
MTKISTTRTQEKHLRFESRTFGFRILKISLIAFGIICGGALSLRAETPKDRVVRISAQVQTNSPQITLSWPVIPSPTSCLLYRKSRDAVSWGASATLAANATNYVDTSVVVGSNYEYRILI